MDFFFGGGGLGLSGVFFADFWLGSLLHVPLDGMAPELAVTLRNEFRFLEARELGVGLFVLGLRHELLSSRKHNQIFLMVVFAAPLARLWSCANDGWPSLLWQALMLSEVLMALVLVISTRGLRRSSLP